MNLRLPGTVAELLEKTVKVEISPERPRESPAAALLEDSSFGSPEPKVLRVGRLFIDCNTRLVTRGESPDLAEGLRLTDKELRLLEVLLSHAGTAVSRETLLHEVWGYVPERPSDKRKVDVNISRLRKKIEPDLIKVVYGKGYLLQTN